MKILVLGANGFIGQHLVNRLSAAGHDVVRGVHGHGAQAEPDQVHVDFTRDHAVQDWVPRLSGCDVVVNLVGIIRETGTRTFLALHELAPRALYVACVEAGVQRIVHFSALGADDEARSHYHLSKRRADAFLQTLPLAWTIVQPSLVFGAGGTSARLFSMLAALPIIPLIGRGGQRVQPVHVDDLCEAVVSVIGCGMFIRRRLMAVGPRAVTFRRMIEALRKQLGLPATRFVPVPVGLVRRIARTASRFDLTDFDAETVDMLERGNEGSAKAMESVLGRSPRAVEQFITRPEARYFATAAKTAWLMPLLRIAIAFLWIVTGVLSFGLYPVEESYALLDRVGVSGMIAPVVLYGAATLDLLLGIGVLALRRREWLWRAQMVLIAAYSAIIAFALPEFWLHPFAPLLKNIPLLAAIYVLHELEPRLP
jgi:uncharacterized protein YbjT (DUF2867 family)